MCFPALHWIHQLHLSIFSVQSQILHCVLRTYGVLYKTYSHSTYPIPPPVPEMELKLYTLTTPNSLHSSPSSSQLNPCLQLHRQNIRVVGLCVGDCCQCCGSFAVSACKKKSTPEASACCLYGLNKIVIDMLGCLDDYFRSQGEPETIPAVSSVMILSLEAGALVGLWLDLDCSFVSYHSNLFCCAGRWPTIMTLRVVAMERLQESVYCGHGLRADAS